MSLASPSILANPCGQVDIKDSPSSTAGPTKASTGHTVTDLGDIEIPKRPIGLQARCNKAIAEVSGVCARRPSRTAATAPSTILWGRPRHVDRFGLWRHRGRTHRHLVDRCPRRSTERVHPATSTACPSPQRWNTGLPDDSNWVDDTAKVLPEDVVLLWPSQLPDQDPSVNSTQVNGPVQHCRVGIERPHHATSTNAASPKCFVP